MNIFSALSQGKGRLNEENMSAILAYLLNPRESHGLGDTVLKEFLLLLDSTGELGLANEAWDEVDVRLEESYELSNGSVRTIDIRVSLFKKELVSLEDEYVEKYRICIENKINPRAAQDEQFLNEFQGIELDVDSDGTLIVMVFLTPFVNSSKLQAEYNNLDEETLGKHKKAWKYWTRSNEEMDMVTISDMLRNVLRLEHEARINPISEYMRHTLKALIVHIDETINITVKERGRSLAGDVIQTVEGELDGVGFTIKRMSTGSILIIDSDGEEVANTKGMLREIIKDKGLAIELERANGKQKNTRTLGRQVIQMLLKK
ncbi:PD-(D/E)XK nuclease family protein [Halalkalibacter alkaliphilus]|uniref:PD-(D/E)XK nuclease family protein n=1 Tax=Halalkalibacter alkaliphilus TaxID=2917993 RepID=A0A9X2CWZ9_9BACI|nr:PD-(D/E)XK nuclease family protein [Halalkalibacter alkaliphilus]MCL7749910.1 PD-(D/E)XK nuclease family protein [Halalkalibacter alkaliphilus]